MVQSDKQVIIWDLDGTLINSAPEIIFTINKALVACGIEPDTSVSPLRIGPPVKQIIRNSYPVEILSEKTLDQVVKEFRSIYDSSDYKNTLVFDGIESILNDSRFEHVIITNKPELATKRIIEYKGWKAFIANVLTPTSFPKVKSKKELFEYFKGIHSNMVPICIGDMQLDCECAKNIGGITIGVLWGTGTKEELEQAGCDYIVNSTTLLNEILINLWVKE